MHGYTFGGHPVSTAVAMANLDIFEREGLNQHVRDTEGAFRATLEKLLDLPIVGDVRGDGFFYGIELVKDKATKETFNDAESEVLLRGFLSKALFDAGLYCRADDRGDPVMQLSPPLICDQSHFDEMEQILRSVLTEGRHQGREDGARRRALQVEPIRRLRPALDRELAELRPVIARNREVDDPRRLDEVARQFRLRLGEMSRLHVCRCRIVAERLDKHVLSRVVDAARPVEPQAPLLAAGRLRESARDRRPGVSVLRLDAELRGNEDHRTASPWADCGRCLDDIFG